VHTPESRKADVEIAIASDVWGGRLSQVLGRDQVGAFLDGLRNSSALQFDGYIDDQPAFVATADSEMVHKVLLQPLHEVGAFWRCCALADHFGVNPRLPDLCDFDTGQRLSIAKLCDIVMDGQHSHAAEGLRLGVPVDHPDLDLIDHVINTPDFRGAIRLDLGPVPLSLLGLNVAEVTAHLELTEATLVNDREELKRAISERPEGPIELVWEGYRGARLVYSRDGDVRRSLFRVKAER
jgi:hypothetical protein